MKPVSGIFTRKFGLLIIYGILFVLLSVGGFLTVTKVFALREIKIVSSTIQVSVDQRLLPKTLLFFPSQRIRAKILADNPVLEDIQFQKNYPHTLLIIPTLRKAAALLITPTRRVLIDERGIVLADEGSVTVGIPQITAPIEALRIGQQIDDKRVEVSLAFVRNTLLLPPIETIDASTEGLIRARAGTTDILFTQESEMDSLLATLQTLLTGFRIKGTLPSVIDLRFDKPVVKF